MVNISHKIGIDADLTTTIKSINSIHGLSQWWTSDVRGATDKGERIQFWFDEQMLEMEVTENQPTSVSWQCTSGPEEWLGTSIHFKLENEEETALYFQHKGWQSESPFHHHCSMKWATFLLSLKDYLEQGHGKPFPQDIKIGRV